MSLLQHLVTVFIVITARYGLATGSQEDFKLLEDSFAQAYEDAIPNFRSFQLRDVPETKRHYIARAPANMKRLPYKPAAAGYKPARRAYRPAQPLVLAPKMYSQAMQPNYAQAPRRNMLFPRPSLLLPQRKTILFSPAHSIASFARRNPYYTQKPRYLQAPRRNGVISPRVLSAYRPMPSYMYNTRFYNTLQSRNPFLYAQRRNLMYAHQRPFTYAARRPYAYTTAMLRSRMPTYAYRAPLTFYAYGQSQQRPFLYARDHSLSGNHLNLNTGTSSHTVSNSVLKAPGHTTTDTHVVNKQHTGGRVRGVAPALKGKQSPLITNVKYPFIGKGSRTRGRVSASAKVNAKASASSSSASSSQSGSSSKTNGGSRTTSGGWGGGAGQGWGSGKNAWGIGYGGGGGGSNWNIPSNMPGIPGMPGKFPGIPNGFPGMPPGGYPSKGYASAAQGTKAKRPSSTLKGQKVPLKPKKGVDAKAFRISKNAKNAKPKFPVGKIKPNLKAYSRRPSPKSTVPFVPGNSNKLLRVQFFSNDPMHRPVTAEWQNLRQRIIADVMKG